MSAENPQLDTPESSETLDSETALKDCSSEVEMEEEKPESESTETLDVEMGDRNPSTPPLSLAGAEELLDDSEEVKDSETDEEEKREELEKQYRARFERRQSPRDSYYRPQPRYPPWGYSGWPEEKSSPTDAGAGLMNLGNTCFLNAVLQCLMHTVPLLNGMILDKDSCICDCETGEFCLLCSLRELVDCSFNSTGRSVAPYKLVNNLSYFSSSFERYQQEDAQEFLQSFLDRLENCFDIKRNNNISAQCSNVVKRVFGGRLVSKLKCCSCGHCSDSYEPCVDYSLGIKDSDDLLTALQSFTKVEKLEDPETKFTCEGCKEQVSVEKQLAFDQAPSVAAFHLKRFLNEGSSVQKIDKHVSFPKELNLRPFVVDNMTDEHLIYNLFAIVVHSGFTSTSGHYYCYIRLSSDMWCKFDDSRVYEVPESDVLKEEAYILFYAKEGNPWFSSFIETHKSCFTSKSSSASPKSVLDNVHSPAVQDKTSCDPSEENNASSASIYWRFEVIDIEDSKPKPDEAEGDKIKDDMLPSPDPTTDGSSDMPVQNVKEEPSPSLPKKVESSNDATSTVENKLSLNPDIFLRSPSPEIYREDKSDAGYSIPRQHLKLINRSNCKRRLERDMDDMETRHACSYMKKNMRGSRAKQLMDAMRGSRSESSKKSRRFTGLDNMDNNNSAPSIRHMVR